MTTAPRRRAAGCRAWCRARAAAAASRGRPRSCRSSCAPEEKKTTPTRRHDSARGGGGGPCHVMSCHVVLVLSFSLSVGRSDLGRLERRRGPAETRSWCGGGGLRVSSLCAVYGVGSVGRSFAPPPPPCSTLASSSTRSEGGSCTQSFRYITSCRITPLDLGVEQHEVGGRRLAAAMTPYDTI